MMACLGSFTVYMYVNGWLIPDTRGTVLVYLQIHFLYQILNSVGLDQISWYQMDTNLSAINKT